MSSMLSLVSALSSWVRIRDSQLMSISCCGLPCLQRAMVQASAALIRHHHVSSSGLAFLPGHAIQRSGAGAVVEQRRGKSREFLSEKHRTGKKTEEEVRRRSTRHKSSQRASDDGSNRRKTARGFTFFDTIITPQQRQLEDQENMSLSSSGPSFSYLSYKRASIMLPSTTPQSTKGSSG